MNKPIVITETTNPIDVRLNANLTGVKRLVLRYIRIALPGFVGTVPDFLYIRLSGINEIPGSLIIQNISSPSNVSNNAVPLHFKPSATVSGGAWYPVLWGFQDPTVGFSIDNIHDLTNFRLEILDDNGTTFALSGNMKIQLIFNALYENKSYVLPSNQWKYSENIKNNLNG